MKILRTRAELRVWREAQRDARVGFVPTMGALHEGHLSLVRRSKEECSRTVASIFVNPLQFGPREDLSRYPRPFEKDCELLKAQGVDALFAPSSEEMYPADRSTQVIETQVSEGLCGAARPGHFNGVCTVVLKLFHLVRPHLAYFGEKDAQQLRVIERMVRDLDVPVEVIRVPTVRETDGLAMSSRNAYLSPDHRERAPRLYNALQAVRESFQKGERRASILENHGRALLEQDSTFRVQYFEIRDQDTLAVFTDNQVPPHDGLILAAVYLGETRLIDNLELN